MTGTTIAITTPTTADEMVEVVGVFDAVWGSTPPVVTVELLTAVAHAGGYVSLARDHDRPGAPAVGASLGILARHDGAPALHSHVTALVADARGTGAGRALEAPSTRLGRGERPRLDRVDVRSARAPQRLVQPRGARRTTCTSTCRRSTERCRTPSTPATSPIDCSSRGTSTAPCPTASSDVATSAAPPAGALLVPTPEDVVELRRTDPVAVARWRADTARRAHGRARRRPPDRRIHPGRGNYVIGSKP